MTLTHQFKKLIKCTNCGKNYKTKMEKNSLYYLCSGYCNYGKDFCSYNPIEEDDLVYTITKHLSINGIGIEGELRNYVRVIEVIGKGYKITYTDGTTSEININQDRFGTMLKY